MDPSTWPIDPKFAAELERRGRITRGANRDVALLSAFLASDFHATALGTLPSDLKVQDSRRKDCQIDEMVNMAVPLKGRYEEKGKGRMLKLHLTDGRQQVMGVEYRFIESLKVNSPAGIKILVTDVFVQCGILFLCPENVVVLGGSVPRLVKAQERAKAVLVKDIVKGSEVKCVDRVYEEAELAAWEWEYRATPSPVPSTATAAQAIPSSSPPQQRRAIGTSSHVATSAPQTERIPPSRGPLPKKAAPVHSESDLPSRKVPTMQTASIRSPVPKPFLKNLVLPSKKLDAVEVVDLVGPDLRTPAKVYVPSSSRHGSVSSEPPSKQEFDVIDLLNDD